MKKIKLTELAKSDLEILHGGLGDPDSGEDACNSCTINCGSCDAIRVYANNAGYVRGTPLN